MSNIFLKKKAEAEAERKGGGKDHNIVDHNKLSIYSNKHKNLSKNLSKLGYNKSFLPANKE
jgi:hypothetical protein